MAPGGLEKSLRRLDRGERGGRAVIQDRGGQCAGAAPDVEPAASRGDGEPGEKRRRHSSAPPADVLLVGIAAFPRVRNGLASHGQRGPRPAGGAAGSTLPHQHRGPPPAVKGSEPKSIGRTARPSGWRRPGVTAVGPATLTTKPPVATPGA